MTKSATTEGTDPNGGHEKNLKISSMTSVTWCPTFRVLRGRALTRPRCRQPRSSLEFALSKCPFPGPTDVY